MEELQRIRELKDAGRRGEALELADRAISGERTPRRLMALYRTRGYIHRSMDRPDLAEEDFRAALKLFDGEEGLRDAVLSRRGLALVHYSRPNMGAALAEHRRELELARRLDDRSILCGTHANLAHLYVNQGDFRAAEEHARQQLSMAAALQDSRLMAVALSNLGRALMFGGRMEKARECFGEQLAMAEEQGISGPLSSALSNLSILEMERGNPEEALNHLQRQLDLARRAGSQQAVSTALGNMSIAHRRLGNLRMALDHAREHFRMAWEKSDWMGMTLALSNMAAVYVNLEDIDRAEQCYGKLVRNAESGGLRQALAEGLVSLARLEEALGRGTDAWRHAERACRLYRAQDDPQRELEACVVALEALAPGAEEAGKLARRAAELEPRDRRLAQLLAVARQRHGLGGPGAEELAETVDDPAALARLHLLQGRRSQALEAIEAGLGDDPTGTELLLLRLSIRRR